jgi:hypothetical protein
VVGAGRGPGGGPEGSGRSAEGHGGPSAEGRLRILDESGFDIAAAMWPGLKWMFRTTWMPAAKCSIAWGIEIDTWMSLATGLMQRDYLEVMLINDAEGTYGE